MKSPQPTDGRDPKNPGGGNVAEHSDQRTPHVREAPFA
jgi:hypothetical protein